jgi:hypothetical protein
VPVVNSSGAPIGIVSEGDLIGRKEAECEEREDWWLTLLAEGEELSSDFLTSLNYPTAHDLMSALVITVGEETRPHRGGGGKREKAISQGHGGAGEEIVNAHLSLGLEIIPIVHRNYDGWTIRWSLSPRRPTRTTSSNPISPSGESTNFRFLQPVALAEAVPIIAVGRR